MQTKHVASDTWYQTFWVALVQEVRSKRSIGIHFATYPLGDEAADAPAADLAEALPAEGVPAAEFSALQHGALLQTSGGKDQNMPPLLPTGER